ncbi:hypothetical protein RFI_34385 [Reticulomyxa filosa]|uniref:Uncharacterized protein n=1 Tax=Reticulomyxa filosa TaxID=46433 RepID=X6LQK2_RETFI|nr:hypothetical protein RFI_34385 [Reticulomyxa filosa]|eukprot:ETO03025.1 hypothetical protein RFI_34385 [Reticulomyxa filosa]
MVWSPLIRCFFFDAIDFVCSLINSLNLSVHKTNKLYKSNSQLPSKNNFGVEATPRRQKNEKACFFYLFYLLFFYQMLIGSLLQMHVVCFLKMKKLFQFFNVFIGFKGKKNFKFIYLLFLYILFLFDIEGKQMGKRWKINWRKGKVNVGWGKQMGKREMKMGKLVVKNFYLRKLKMNLKNEENVENKKKKNKEKKKKKIEKKIKKAKKKTKKKDKKKSRIIKRKKADYALRSVDLFKKWVCYSRMRVEALAFRAHKWNVSCACAKSQLNFDCELVGDVGTQMVTHSLQYLSPFDPAKVYPSSQCRREQMDL